MVATWCLLCCVLPAAQPAPLPPTGGGWLLVPRLGAGQEPVYGGSFPGAGFFRLGLDILLRAICFGRLGDCLSGGNLFEQLRKNA